MRLTGVFKPQIEVARAYCTIWNPGSKIFSSADFTVLLLGYKAS
jgi:hypothetical protein